MACFFSNDIEAASRAIWKKYAFGKKKAGEDADFKRLVSSRREYGEISLRLRELWFFAMSYEYEMELNPITLAK